MKRKNATRSALFTSIISLLLCVSMLVGTTFAWFTDSVVSGTNVIAAGNLDVELYHSKNKDVKIIDANKVNSATKLFADPSDPTKEIVWEPGVVAYTNLKVANVGTLALTYRMTINSEAVNYVEIDGTKYTLEDVLKVAVVKDGFEGDRAAAHALVDEHGKSIYEALDTFLLEGELEGDTKSATYGIVIYWEPDTDYDDENGNYDNLFNVNNGAVTSNNQPLTINLGINLFATQEEYEHDSFDDQYDQLADKIITAGEVVEIVDETVTDSYENNGTMIVKDSTVNNSLTNNGVLNIENSSIDVDNRGLTTTGEANLTNVQVDAGTPGTYAMVASGKDATMTLDGVTLTSGGGAVGATNGATVIVNSGDYKVDSDSTSGRYVIYTVGEGSTVIVNGGTFSWDKNDNQKRAYVHAEAGTTVIINGGTFGKASTRSGYTTGIKCDGEVIIKGGTFGFDPTKWVALGYEAIKNGETWTVSAIPPVEDNTALEAAIDAGEKTIVLASGEYSLPATTGDVTITGTKDAVITINKPKANNVTLNGVTVKGSGIYTGIQHSNSVVYENCTIYGLQCLYADTVVFKNCDLIADGAEHNVWTYGGNEVSFIDCDFTYGDRAVNCYSDQASDSSNVTFTNCTFTKVVGKATTGAIETNSSLMTGLKVTINNCTVNEGDLWFVAEKWDSLKGAKTTVIVDGETQAATAEQLRALAANATGDVALTLAKNITLGDDTTQKSMGAYFPNATSVTIDGNGKTLTLKGQMPGSDWAPEYYAGIYAPKAEVTVKDLTIVTNKLDKNGNAYSADRKSVYTFVRGTDVLFENVKFDGGVQVTNNTKFVKCFFEEDVLVKDDAGYAKNGMFCVFIDFQYSTDGVCTVDFEGCTFKANGYGCVKAAGDKGANITVNVKDCSFTNNCPSNSWSQTTPKYDVKMTGDNITVNDLGGNTWDKSYGEG